MIKPEHKSDADKTKCGSKYTNKHIAFTNERGIQINADKMQAEYRKPKTKRITKKHIELPAWDYDPNSQKMRIMAGTPIIARNKYTEMSIAK